MSFTQCTWALLNVDAPGSASRTRAFGGAFGSSPGVLLAYHHPNFCISLGSQIFCFTSCSLYSKVKCILCVFQIEMFVMVFECVLSNSHYCTLNITAMIVPPPSTHSPRACLSCFWLHLLLLSFSYVLHL